MPQFSTEDGQSTSQPQPPANCDVARLAADLCRGGAAACAAVRQLLQLAPSMTSWRGEHGWTPLHYCAVGGDASADAAAELLAAGADPDAVDDAGWTPLHQAADKNACRVAAELLARPACRPDRRCPEGRTPMTVAAESWRGSVRMARLLLAAGSTASAAAEAAEVAERAAAALPAESGKAGMARLLRAAANGLAAAGGLRAESSRHRCRSHQQTRTVNRKLKPTPRSPFGCGCSVGSSGTTHSSVKSVFRKAQNQSGGTKIACNACSSSSSSIGSGSSSSYADKANNAKLEFECVCTNAIVSLSCRQCGIPLLVRRLDRGLTAGQWRLELARARPRLPGPRQLVAQHSKRCRAGRHESLADDDADATAGEAWRVRILARSDSPEELALFEKIFAGRRLPKLTTTGRGSIYPRVDER